MSRQLTKRSIDHVLLERGEVANSWQTERWDTLRLLTPNWQSRLPGYSYQGDDPDGYMTMPEVVAFLKRYASQSEAPVRAHTLVTKIRPIAGGYEVATDKGPWRCRTLVLASGACNVPAVPALAADLPHGIASMSTMAYRNPAALPDGGVMIVGGSASGIQLAAEIQASGRRVVLSIGEHVRLPRTYRGRDIKWWMDVLGIMDVRHDEVEDLGRVRRLPSLQLIGSPERTTIDVNSLAMAGVEIVGRLVGIRSGKVQFSGALPNHCALADLKMNRLLTAIDAWIEDHASQRDFDPACRYEPTNLRSQSILDLNLKDGGIRTVIWATGYRPDYSWLDVPVLDRKGRIHHDGGVVASPGMYVMGLPFMRRRKSSFIDGAADDSADLAAHLALGLQRTAA
jgi:putative flavoprotein involved in K+ transport